MTVTEQEALIMDATIEEFNEKGTKFTMDDIAKRIHISKKTLYKYFSDKESLVLKTVEYGFDQVKLAEKKILEDDSLDVVEKLKRVLIALPDRYKNMDWRRMYQIKERYPKEYRQIEARIENGWEGTIALLSQGIQEGRFRKISIAVFKTIVESTLKSFISDEQLFESDLSYEEALNEMLDIVLMGIIREDTDQNAAEKQ